MRSHGNTTVSSSTKDLFSVCRGGHCKGKEPECGGMRTGSIFIEQFIKKANELPEANRRLLDLLYETAWHTIYVFKYGTAPEKVPAPWYDRMGGVEK